MFLFASFPVRTLRFCFFGFFLIPLVAKSAETLDLSGTWRFALDVKDSGVQEQWFNRSLSDSIRLPGILQAQGYGNEISASTPWVLSLYDHQWYLREPYKRYAEMKPAKVPFLSQPPRHYLGVAWYQRDLTIPDSWRGRVVALFLERTRWESTVWLDDRKIGSDDTLVAPHEFDLGEISPGVHRLTIRLDNRAVVPDYRPDSHAVSDSLGSTWNGITGRIELRATTLIALGESRVFTDLVRKSATVEVTLLNRTSAPGRGTLSVGATTLPVSWAAEPRTVVKIDFPLPADARPWSEFDPALQRATLRLQGNQAQDERELVFGLRDFRTSGTLFLLNGRQIDLRGTHHGGDFPLTGYPPSDLAYWRTLFQVCRKWGLNHMRFHSWCPPEAAFTAADEIGFYLQPECGMWNDFDPEGVMAQRLEKETERLLRAFGNHPSFLLLSPSNEPGGKWKEVLPAWVSHFRALDSRHLYTAGTGWSLRDQPGPFGDKIDYLAVHRIGGRAMRGRPGWFGKDYDASMEQVDRPNLTHEVGQWCAYPNFDVIAKFTGYLRPGNFEIARDQAEAKGLLARNAELARASGMFQVACYKEEIEANLRSRKLRGFQLLDLHDYLGQGTALVGLLDPFWQEKGYLTAEQFRRFCSETVPLARLTKRVFAPEEDLRVPVEIAHFGAAPLADAVAYWKIQDSRGATLLEGEWPAQTIPIGNGLSLGTVEAKLGKLPAPGAFRLVVGLRGTKVENDWNFWIYPTPETTPELGEVRFSRSWAEVEALLAHGEKVLYQPRTADLAWTCPPIDDLPIFWNRLMGPQWGRMLGVWCDAAHPALAGFPTESFGDWQWSGLLRRARAVNLDGLPRDLQPIVQVIDDWNRNYKLAAVFECQVGPGRLLVSSINSGGQDRSAAQQLHHSLIAYMNSDRFHPKTAVSVEQLRSFIFNTRIMHQLGAEPVGSAGLVSRVIDGDPNTTWLSGRPKSRPGELKRRRRLPEFAEGFERVYPHSFALKFPRPVAFSGVVLMPRQDDRDHAGDIREYTLSISDDGKTWNDVSNGELPSTFDPITLRFGRTVTARQVKFTGLSGFAEDPSAALAELAVIYEGPSLELPPGDDGDVRYQGSRSNTPEMDEGPAPRP